MAGSEWCLVEDKEMDMMYLVDFAVSLIIGVLAGLGVGSGGLFLLYVTLFREVAHKSAQGMNLLFFLFALTGSVLVHLCRRTVSAKFMGKILLFGIPGSVCGSLLISYLPVGVLRTVFGSFLIFMGLLTLFEKKTSSQRGKKENNA